MIGVTVQQRARALGVRMANRWDARALADAEAKAEIAVYEAETGRSAKPQFITGAPLAQWEYGLRKSDYWTKDARERVRIMVSA